MSSYCWTYRDYVPSIGLLNSGYITEHSGNCLNQGRRRYFDQNTGLNTWLAITANGANSTDYAFKGWHVQPSTTAYGAQVVTHVDANNATILDATLSNTYNTEQLFADTFKSALTGDYTTDNSAILGLRPLESPSRPPTGYL